MDSNCVFCKIAENKIKDYTIYENDKIKAILDVNPSTTGHILVIPKVHVKDIYELDEELGAELFKVVIKLCKVVKKTYNLEGLNIIQNNGELAGQSVMHFHMHIIPRDENDKIRLGWNSISLTEKDFEKTVKDITSNMV